MKLHLPLFIRKSVLACMLALSSIATTVVSGTMVAGSAMWAISNVAAEAQEEVQTVTITDNEDGRLTTTPPGSLIIMNLQGTSAGRWLVGPGTVHNVLADVQIDSLSITNGSSSATYNFAGDITGDGVFERTSGAKASKQTYVFTGDMSLYSGEMKLLKQNDASTFKFIGNQSGMGAITIVAGNSIVVDGATMNNSSIISAGTFTVQGTSFIAGDVSSTGTLNVNGKTTFAGDVNCGGTLLVSEDTEITSYGAFTFGENAVINLARANAVTDAQRTQTYKIFSSAGAGTSNFSELSIADLTGLVTAGRSWSFNADGTLVGVLSNNSLTHSASGDFTWNTTASSFSKGEETVTFTQGDDVTFTGTGTKVSFGESLDALRVTVAESANITISGSGSGSLSLEEAVVYGTLNLNKGGNPGNGAFTGAIDVYGTLNLNTGDVTGWSDSLGIKSIDIYEGGEMVVNTTGNQTGAGIVINLQGGSISGVANSNFDLGYGGTLHGYSTISALAADGATAAQPTVSTISGATITLRQNHTTISVEENARLDISSGILVKGNKSDLNGEGSVPSHLLAGLVKTGAGELRLSGNNTYTQATTVAEGTLTLTGGAALASSSVAVNRGAVFKLDTAADTSINYANQISGSGLLLKTGAGSAAIGGLADSFAGHIDLQQGTLSVGSPVVISSGRELSLGMTGAVLNSSLSLGDGKLSIDYSGSGAATSLNNSALTLLGGTQLQLSNLTGGDGKTYELFAGIGSLLGSDGNALVLDDTNNAISNYFDSTRPGSGFWAGATLQLTDAGTLQLVLHNETVKEAITITSRQTNPSAYQYYAGIAFEDISYSGRYAYGGAIYGDGSTITLSDNGSVSFSGITVSSFVSYAYGGAIYGDTITLSNNGSVVFEGNTASSDYDYANGGAIYGYGDVTLSDNGSVSFSGNTASASSDACGGAIYGGYSTITLSDNGSVTFSGNTASSFNYYADGGAIYGGSSSPITLSNNGSVTFSGNTASGFSSGARGGAIYGYDSTITLSDNGSVTFSGNTASSSSASAFGGAIYGYGSTITLSDNGSVTFSGNTASSSDYYAYGGAIYGSVTMKGNGDVSFSGNTASSSDAYSYANGGAIYGSVTMAGNGDVSFSGNTASTSSYTARGGAIYGASYSTITLSDNGSVSFSGNTASSYSAFGGAICGEGSTITLSDNGSVTFSGNTASASSDAYGGAIYASGNLSIRNNESVLFEKNVEKSGSSYRLRSIYAGGSGDAISLSAAVGKSIEFRDSVYIASGSTVNLNADYTYLDEAGESVTIRQTGDIIFTGADTEQHLNDLLEAAGAGRTATAQEIRLSRTTAVNAMTNLYGGRLRVEEGAIYQGQGITAMEGSAATVRVQNATLSHSGYDLTFNAGTTLELAGANSISGNLNLLDGSTLHIDFAGNEFTTNLDGSPLALTGDAFLRLTGAGNGDGKTYTLLTGVSGLLDAQGNAITLDDTNNAISNYFDSTQPGTGFWADATLQLSADGILRLVRHSEAVKAAVTISTRQTGSVDYQYYEGVHFADIEYTAASSYAWGGAIYGGSYSTITLSNNGSVVFEGNTASSSDDYAYGGAIDGGTITLSDNGSVVFEGNTASSSSYDACGGAISGYAGSTITLSDNGSVVFEGNTASSSSSYARGGAIYGDSSSTITLSNNERVTFSGNTASANVDYDGDAYGGAIDGSVTMTGNGDVTFSGNTASGQYADGGAIDGTAITLSNNGSVTFNGNTASGQYAFGGAIDGHRDVTLSNNESVTFSGNTASSYDSHAYGGAIDGYGDSTITLSDNESVIFSGNTASALGGAIYTQGDLSIRNNDSVEFYQNAEVVNGNTYRLRSIYADGGSDDEISLSAAAGKSITFRDSIYIGEGSSFKLNEAYEGKAQLGDIIFTGATTVDDLYTVKDNVAGTEVEIRLSRTTEVNTLTNLYGGRLRVEEGAIYQGRGITAMEGSGATVRVQNAMLSHSGYDLTFNAGTTLELAGNNTIAGNVQMLGSSSLVFDNTHGNGTTYIIGSLGFGSDVSLALGNQAYGSNEVLLYVSDAVSGWDAAHLMVQGNSYTADSFTWVDNLLVLNYDESSFNRYFNGSANYNERHEGNVIRHRYESLAFTTETSSSQGGAIYGAGSAVILLSDNGSVSFRGNTASSSSYASGGAIYGDSSSTITLSNNGSVVFEGNTASSSYSSDSRASGGAIYGGSITLSNNGSVVFEGNTASSPSSYYTYGGAICGYGNSTFTLSDNGSVTFSGNTASSTESGACGGAIYWFGDITLSNNGSVAFSGNTASTSFSATGGAIYGDVTMTGNGAVSFCGNTASSSDYSSSGGAIDGSVTMTGNGAVSFSGNTASSSYYAEGGAIYGSTITLSDNGSVTFSGNTASGRYSNGGAIYASGNLSIRNNESVLFEKNVEKSGSSYRLRSIYADGSGDAISLSAAVGKSIEFRDSVYIDSDSTVNLNADYTYQDAEGVSVTVKQKGDIIFTGADTEQHLNNLLEAAGAGRTATAQEILNSRTTEVCAMTNLYGGRLRVEEGAIYQGRGITAMEGSAATVRVQNAELSLVGYDLTFNAGTSLEVAGNSTIRGNVGLLADSLFKLEQAATLSLHETLQADAAELTVQGTALLAGSSTLNASLTLADGATLDMMSLDAGAVTINGALTFGGQVEMGEHLLAAVEELTSWEPGLVLFTGLTDLVLPVAASELESDRVLASSVFSNVVNPDLYVTYHVVDNVGSLLVMNVPEPATSTLSLLALTALALRRRRK